MIVNLNIVKSAKISVKLTIIYAFMFSLVLLLLDASVLYGVKYYLYAQANKEVDGTKTIILNKITLQTEHMNLSDKELLLDVPPKENIFVKIVQGNKVLNTSNKFNYNIKITEPYSKIKHIEEQEKHLMYENIKINTKDNSIAYIQIVKDMANEYNFLKILFVFMAIADFIGIIASILLGYAISKRMLKPIDNITRTAQNISINNLKERINVTDPDDELRRLGDTFNHMIDRLQDAFLRQVQFVSDASHELRTPIAVIQGYANLLDRWGKDDREALEKSIYAIRLEASNMSNLVERLLFLAKGDSDALEIDKKNFMLNNLIDEVVIETKLIAPSHFIYSSRNDAISIYADYKMLKQMLRIFIDNSIKFTSENGKIDVSSKLQDKTVKITINDNGIGIPQDEIKNIFSRFYTVDKSRSKEKGGSGLGLAIAKWIVDIHHGTINVESAEGKGTRVVVTLNLD